MADPAAICLQRAEGNRATDSFAPVTVTTWAGANAILRSWARTAPVSGFTYHKVDVWVTWPDGAMVKLRYDLRGDETATADLRGYLAGLGCDLRDDQETR